MNLRHALLAAAFCAATSVLHAQAPTTRPAAALPAPPAPKPSAPVAAATPAPPAAAPDLVTLKGETFKNARVMSVEPDGVTYAHARGVAKVLFEELPEAIRQQHGYDPAKAAAFALQDAREQQRIAADTERTIREGKLRSQFNEFREKGMNMILVDIQVMEDGILGKASTFREEIYDDDVASPTGLDANRTVRMKRKDVNQQEVGTIFVQGTEKWMVDGLSWTGKLWPAGTYSYTAVNGARRTVWRFVPNPETAFQMLQASAK